MDRDGKYYHRRDVLLRFDIYRRVEFTIYFTKQVSENISKIYTFKKTTSFHIEWEYDFFFA